MDWLWLLMLGYPIAYWLGRRSAIRECEKWLKAHEGRWVEKDTRKPAYRI